jgi:hypothetical protein
MSRHDNDISRRRRRRPARQSDRQSVVSSTGGGGFLLLPTPNQLPTLHACHATDTNQRFKNIETEEKKEIHGNNGPTNRASQKRNRVGRTKYREKWSNFRNTSAFFFFFFFFFLSCMQQPHLSFSPVTACSSSSSSIHGLSQEVALSS